MSVGLACGPLRPGGCGRFLGVVAQPWTSNNRYVSSPILFETDTDIPPYISAGSTGRESNIFVETGYVSASIGASLLFVRCPDCLLTCLLCSVAALLQSCRRDGLGRRSWRARCDGRVARCVPWSCESFIPGPWAIHNDTHRLQPSRCKSDGFLGLCGLA